jgi:hypothetical protein
MLAPAALLLPLAIELPILREFSCFWQYQGKNRKRHHRTMPCPHSEFTESTAGGEVASGERRPSKLRNRRGDDSEPWRRGHRDREKETTKLLAVLLINSFGHQRTYMATSLRAAHVGDYSYSEGCI